MYHHLCKQWCSTEEFNAYTRHQPTRRLGDSSPPHNVLHEFPNHLRKAFSSSISTTPYVDAFCRERTQNSNFDQVSPGACLLLIRSQNLVNACDITPPSPPQICEIMLQNQARSNDLPDACLRIRTPGFLALAVIERVETRRAR